jgi:2-amino-4-hydroxy-6-hydroxymethyldihydropteridine diphosphokinase
MPIIAYIGLGSNIGDRKNSCLQAIALLARAGRVNAVSSFYCTEPVGFQEQEEFINAVVELETHLLPQQLLTACRAIEDELGRTRTQRWGPRTIDLDVLLYGDEIINSPDLTIPHPLLTTRGFVLIPLCEIAPHVEHPILQKTIIQLLQELKDPHRVIECGSVELS